MIKIHKASLIEHAGDIAYLMGWDLLKSRKQINKTHTELSGVEKVICNLMKEYRKLDTNTLSEKTGRTTSEITSVMLELEFKGIVKSLPGNMYGLL